MSASRRPDPSPYDTGAWGTPERPCPSEHTIAACLDGELGPVAERAVEAHLDACPACAAVHRRLEGLSGLLRSWEQGPGAVEPPPRLYSRVMREVAPEAGVLRLETVRAGRRARIAAAAAVLAVAAGAALGAAGASHAPDLGAWEPASAAVRWSAPPVHAPRGGAEAVTLPVATPVLDAAPARLALASRPPSADGVFRDGAGVEAMAALVPHVEAQRRLGEEVCVVDGRSVPAWALPAFDHARRTDGWITRRALLASEPATRDPLSAGRALTDVVPLPAPSAVASFLRSAAGATDPATPGRGGVVLTALPRGAGAPAPAAPAASPLDLAEAVAAGRARVLPDGADGAALLAFEVAAGAPPLVVVAGEIVEGGAGDRVVAEGAWVPTSDVAQVVRLRCVPVARGAPRPAGLPSVTGYLAGPVVRSLLARGEQDIVVQVAVEGLLAGASLVGPADAAPRSLVALHRVPPGSSWDPEARAVVLLRALGADAAGFVASDPSGRLQGVEHTDLAGAAGPRLLRRLLAGYLAESRARSQTDAPRMGVPAETALVRLAHPAVRVVPRRAAVGVRLTGEEPRTGLVLEGLSSDDGAVRLLSGFVPDVVYGSDR